MPLSFIPDAFEPGRCCSCCHSIFQYSSFKFYVIRDLWKTLQTQDQRHRMTPRWQRLKKQHPFLIMLLILCNSWLMPVTIRTPYRARLTPMQSALPEFPCSWGNFWLCFLNRRWELRQSFSGSLWHCEGSSEDSTNHYTHAIDNPSLESWGKGRLAQCDSARNMLKSENQNIAIGEDDNELGCICQEMKTLFLP